MGHALSTKLTNDDKSVYNLNKSPPYSPKSGNNMFTNDKEKDKKKRERPVSKFMNKFE